MNIVTAKINVIVQLVPNTGRKTSQCYDAVLDMPTAL